MSQEEERFKVDVLRTGQASFGELILARDRATLESWPIRRVLVIHTRQNVLVVRPRVDLFRYRSVFVLQGSAGVYGVRAAPSSVNQLEVALLAAGFELVERRTTFQALPRPPF